MRKLSLTLFFILIISWFGGLLAFNQYINSYKTDETTKTEAIVALTGGRNRIAEAVNLLNQGLAEKLFISGVQKDVSLKEIQKRADIHISTQREIIIGKKATNTIENAFETINWLRDENIKSIRLVTSNYHIPRSLQEFKTLRPDLVIVVHPVYSEKVHKNWWKSWRNFGLIASEYNKFLYVYVTNNLKIRGL